MAKFVTLLICLIHSGLCSTLVVQAKPVVPAGRDDPICGAKCLYVILRTYGRASESYRETVAELGPAPRNGYSLFQLEQCARKHDLYAESVKLNKEELTRMCQSCSVIIHLNISGETNSGHFVLCESVSELGATIFDAMGSPTQVSNEIFSVWTGAALLVSKNPIDLATTGPSKWPVSWILLTVGVVVAALVVTTRFRSISLEPH